MTKLTGVILAGGRGSRLGGLRKADLRVGGISLLERVVAAMSCQCGSLLIAANSASFFTHGDQPVDAICVPDASGPSAGPISGLAGAVAWLQQYEEVPDFLLTAAVDTPFFPEDFAIKSLEKIADNIDVVFGAEDGQAFPTNALWRFAALQDLPDRVAEGRRIRGFRAIVAAEKTAFLDYPAGRFANVNTLADLLSCQRRALKFS